jgi:hypothetical protein
LRTRAYHEPTSRRALRAGFAMLAFLAPFLAPFLISLSAMLPRVGQSAAFAAEKAAVWKISDQALLRVDDRAVKDWNIYQTGKKPNPLLLQIGPRYLLVDGRERRIFEIDPARIEHKGADLSWDPADHPEKALETSNWIVRDVGLAYRISARLVAENHLLDLQIPHPLDVRPLNR